MHEIVELYCDVDDFRSVFILQCQQHLFADSSQQRQRNWPIRTCNLQRYSSTRQRQIDSIRVLLW
jgi:hypothetical protein